VRDVVALSCPTQPPHRTDVDRRFETERIHPEWIADIPDVSTHEADDEIEITEVPARENDVGVLPLVAADIPDDLLGKMVLHPDLDRARSLGGQGDAAEVRVLAAKIGKEMVLVGWELIEDARLNVNPVHVRHRMHETEACRDGRAAGVARIVHDPLVVTAEAQEKRREAIALPMVLRVSVCIDRLHPVVQRSDGQPAPRPAHGADRLNRRVAVAAERGTAPHP